MNLSGFAGPRRERNRTGAQCQPTGTQGGDRRFERLSSEQQVDVPRGPNVAVDCHRKPTAQRELDASDIERVDHARELADEIHRVNVPPTDVG